MRQNQNMTQNACPDHLLDSIRQEIQKGCKYLIVCSCKQAMLSTLDGKIYAVSNTDGRFLCDLLESDLTRLAAEQKIVQTAPISDMHFFSDWAVANRCVRDAVFSQRVVFIFTDENR